MSTDVTQFAPISSRPEFARILKTNEHYARSSQPVTAGDKLNGWFDRLMLQSGLEFQPIVLLLLCLLSAAVFGGGAFVIQENVLLGALTAAIGAVVPIVVAMTIRGRRQTQIMKLLPETISKLARAARTGRSLDQCFLLIAGDTSGPLGHELKLCNRKLEMGLDMSAALRELPERTGVVS
ncbi:MAG: type II secretion system F family protein, partial [Planctomycetes bacterium]|nr:type II secretion system F family protein [Planctomycetota bacterium]